MVAVIHASSSLRNALNYNEQKVKTGKAECLSAGNYPKDVEHLNFYQKLARLENQAHLNLRTKVNSVHISLNFDLSEKLSRSKYEQIAGAYLEKIGFARQPYLVYAHHDAGHPHLHIVTTNIQANGRRIELHNLGKNQSEKARKEIEQAFGLKPAKRAELATAQPIQAVHAQKVQYGKSETKRAITNVLDAVLTSYKYTSLPELNAILKQYNVVADRGEKGSRAYEAGGLTYRILDENGSKVGVPIKASSFYNKPTLKHLETRFEQNKPAREPYKVRVKNVIDLALLRNANHSLQSLTKALEKEGIHTAIRQNDQGLIYGLTYVDHQTKCVFNGSDLGKAYSANGLQARCSRPEQTTLDSEGQERKISQQERQRSVAGEEQKHSVSHTFSAALPGAIDELLQPKKDVSYLPHPLKRSKKKKRKRTTHYL